MGKHDIVDRINRSGRFKNWQPDPTAAFIPTPLGNGTPQLKNPIRPLIVEDNLLSVTAQVPIKVPFKILLSRAPRQFVADVRAYCDELLRETSEKR